MSGPDDTNGSEQDATPASNEPEPAPTGGATRMWLSGFAFLVFAVVTFIAGDDNRWVSIPAAILAAVALIDFLSINQRRRRATPE